jgi:HTH-type transcriptional regulator / antitoxin HigA
MNNSIKNTYNPDYAVHPGEILEEMLEALNITKTALAERSGLTLKHISQIINGKDPITPDSAIKFARVLGVEASLLHNLDATYRLYTAKASARVVDLEEISWINTFPIKELVSRKLIANSTNDEEKAEKLLNFFGIGSVRALKQELSALQVAYRQSPSFKTAPQAAATWLRIGELEAQQLESLPYDKSNFNASLAKIRELTRLNPIDFQPEMETLCRNAGVILAFVPELKGTHISGATKWLAPNKALIMLSLRHKSDDHFWFSFFHEAAHVLLHGKKKSFLDGNRPEDNQEEKEADIFASEMLIPKNEYTNFIENNNFTGIAIRRLAKRIGIAPGIVVGRLQHDQIIPFNAHNALKKKFVFISQTQ